MCYYNVGDIMRTFYIFRIKKEMSIITHDSPYNLFKTIEDLYYLDNINLGLSYRLYESIFDSFDIEEVESRVKNTFYDNNYYFKENNKHVIYNKYKPENSSLLINRTHLLLKSDVIKPTLLVNYTKEDNIFVCDFKNIDYFWLNEIVI